MSGGKWPASPNLLRLTLPSGLMCNKVILAWAMKTRIHGTAVLWKGKNNTLKYTFVMLYDLVEDVQCLIKSWP